MRTTLSIDDDVLLAAQELARRERRSAGAVISELARRGLHSDKAAVSVARNGFPVLQSRGTAVSNALIDRLREEDDE